MGRKRYDHIADSKWPGGIFCNAVYFYLFFCYWPVRRIGIRPTINTSGVITLCENMAALSPEQREKTDIVFFDNEESGFIGSALFKRKHKNEPKDKLVMKFDCVSDGDYFLIIQNKKHGGNSAEL